MLMPAERIGRAIQEWAKETRVEVQMNEHARHPDFWDQLRDLIKIIRPIHEAQVMPKSQNANIIHVSMHSNINILTEMLTD